METTPPETTTEENETPILNKDQVIAELTRLKVEFNKNANKEELVVLLQKTLEERGEAIEDKPDEEKEKPKVTPPPKTPAPTTPKDTKKFKVAVGSWTLRVDGETYEEGDTIEISEKKAKEYEIFHLLD